MAMRLPALALVLAGTAGLTQGGKVVPITDADWDEKLVGGPWIVEFYAPWCAHCKAFAPVWEESAEKLSDAVGVKFAKVDATYETKAAARFSVKSYPKVFFLPEKYSEDGQYREFKGGRNAEAVEKFLYKITGPPVPVLTEKTLDPFKGQNDVVFVSVGADSGSEHEKTYTDIATKYIDSIYMGSAKDSSLISGSTPPSTPAVAALNSQAEDTDDYAQWYVKNSEHTMEEFVIAHQFPPMVALGRKNFWQIANSGKLILLAIVDPAGKAESSFLEAATKVARRNVYSVRSGWLDGVEWEKYVHELFLVTSEQVQQGAAVVYDAANKQFYSSGTPSTEAELQALIDDALNGRIQPQNTERGFQKNFKKYFTKFVEFLEDNPWALGVLFLPLAGLGYLLAFSGSDEPAPKTD